MEHQGKKKISVRITKSKLVQNHLNSIKKNKMKKTLPYEDQLIHQDSSDFLSQQIILPSSENLYENKQEEVSQKLNMSDLPISQTSTKNSTSFSLEKNEQKQENITPIKQSLSITEQENSSVLEDIDLLDLKEEMAYKEQILNYECVKRYDQIILNQFEQSDIFHEFLLQENEDISEMSDDLEEDSLVEQWLDNDTVRDNYNLWDIQKQFFTLLDEEKILKKFEDKLGYQTNEYEIFSQNIEAILNIEPQKIQRINDLVKKVREQFYRSFYNDKLKYIIECYLESVGFSNRDEQEILKEFTEFSEQTQINKMMEEDGLEGIEFDQFFSLFKEQILLGEFNQIHKFEQMSKTNQEKLKTTYEQSKLNQMISIYKVVQQIIKNKKNEINKIDESFSKGCSKDDEEEEQKIESNSTNDQKQLIVKKSYSINYKLQAIQFFEQGNSMYKTAKIFNVDKKCISDWIKKKDQLLSIPNSKRQSTFSMKGKFSKCKNTWLFENAYQFVQEQWKQNLTVTSHSIIQCFYKTQPKLKTKTLEYMHQLCFYFRKKFNISLRIPSIKFVNVKESQTEEAARGFVKSFYEIRDQFRFEDHQIYNMDQTSVCYQTLPHKVYSERGNKKVQINASKNHNQRVTVILTVRKDGKKLPPFIIFKGAADGQISKEVKTFNSKKVQCSVQENGWANQEILQEWVSFFYKSQSIKSKFLLIVDRFSVHKNHLEDFLNLQQEQKLMFIPQNCTPKCQPLDVGIIHPFKQQLRKLFIQNQGKDVDRKSLKQQIILAWENIESNLVVNAFNKCLN